MLKMIVFYFVGWMWCRWNSISCLHFIFHKDEAPLELKIIPMMCLTIGRTNKQTNKQTSPIGVISNDILIGHRLKDLP